MRNLLLFFLLGLLFVSTATAQTYSCRDKQGKLLFSDKLSNMPSECLTEATEVTSEQAGTLNFVPNPSTSAGASQEVENQIREVDRQAEEKNAQAGQLEQRAKSLANQYQDAVARKTKARRSWNYSSRETVEQAESEIQQARQGKQQLLEELPRAAISGDNQTRIKEHLGQIEDN